MSTNTYRTFITEKVEPLEDDILEHARMYNVSYSEAREQLRIQSYGTPPHGYRTWESFLGVLY